MVDLQFRSRWTTNSNADEMFLLTLVIESVQLLTTSANTPLLKIHTISVDSHSTNASSLHHPEVRCYTSSKDPEVADVDRLVVIVMCIGVGWARMWVVLSYKPTNPFYCKLRSTRSSRPAFRLIDKT